MMDDIQLLLGVVGLLVLRIGVPVLVLFILGALVNAWQNRREQRVISHQFSPGDD